MYKSLMKKCLLDLKFDESLIASIIIDERTTLKEFQLHESGTGTQKNFDDYKLKDRIVRRTMGDFQKCMFPGVIIEPRGGHNRQDLKKMPETSSSSSSSSSFLPPSSSTSTSLFPYKIAFNKGTFPTLSIPESTVDHVLINSIFQHFVMNKSDLISITKIFNEKMNLNKKKLSKKRTVNDDDDDYEENYEENIDEIDLEEEVGNNNDGEDDENEDDDVQEDDDDVPKCATMGAKKRSIIVSSIEEPIRKSSRNRKKNSFLSDFCQ